VTSKHELIPGYVNLKRLAMLNQIYKDEVIEMYLRFFLGEEIAK